MSLAPASAALTLDSHRLSLLAGVVYRAPRPGQVHYLRNPALLERWPGISELAERGKALLQESTLARETPEKVAADFDRFLTGDPELSQLPLARRILPVAAAHLAARFADADLLPSDTTVPADHLGVILAAIARASERGDMSLAQSLTSELWEPWAPEAVRDLALRSSTLFYQGIFALIAAAF